MSKDAFIKFRCTDEFKTQIEALASKENRTVSNYVENLLKKEIKTMREVMNCKGKQIDFDVAVEFMDDEIREDLHSKLAPCSDQVFFTAYEKAHENRFDVVWELSKTNPVY